MACAAGVKWVKGCDPCDPQLEFLCPSARPHRRCAGSPISSDVSDEMALVLQLVLGVSVRSVARAEQQLCTAASAFQDPAL